MKNSIKRNYMYNMFYEVLKIIVPLFTTPYLARVLGAENIGIYSYTISITTYFILFGSLGISMYGKREIAYVQNDSYKRSKAFFEITILRFITLGISLLIFYMGFCLDNQYTMYYKILTLNIIAESIDISWFFQGLEEFKKTVTRNTIVKIASVICIFLFVKSREDLYKYFLIYVISNLLGNMSFWLFLKRYVEKVKISELNIFKHLKPTIALFIPQMATQIYTVLDKTMIGSIVANKSEVGYYEQAQKIINLLLTIATSLGTVMMPRIANTYAKGNKEKVKEYMDNSFAFILMLAFPLMFGLMSITKKFVPIFYGDGYEKVIGLINIISPIIVFIGISNIVGTQYLLPTKQQKKYTISVIMGATANLLLNSILIVKFEAYGASIATVIAEAVVTGTQLFLVRNEIKIIDILKISRKYIIAAIIMFLVSMLIGGIIKKNLLSLIIQVSVSIGVYFSLLIVMRDELILKQLKKVLGKEFLKK